MLGARVLPSGAAGAALHDAWGWLERAPAAMCVAAVCVLRVAAAAVVAAAVAPQVEVAPAVCLLHCEQCVGIIWVQVGARMRLWVT